MHAGAEKEDLRMFDPDLVIDDKSHEEMMAKLTQENFDKALKNQHYLDHVFGLVHEAVAWGIF